MTLKGLLEGIREKGEELVLKVITYKGQPISTTILFFRGGRWIFQTTTNIEGKDELIEEFVSRDVAVQEVRTYLVWERERVKRGG